MCCRYGAEARRPSRGRRTPERETVTRTCSPGDSLTLLPVMRWPGSISTMLLEACTKYAPPGPMLTCSADRCAFVDAHWSNCILTCPVMLLSRPRVLPVHNTLLMCARSLIRSRVHATASLAAQHRPCTGGNPAAASPPHTSSDAPPPPTSADW